jgi:hypothetical protein
MAALAEFRAHAIAPCFLTFENLAMLRLIVPDIIQAGWPVAMASRMNAVFNDRDTTNGQPTGARWRSVRLCP